ncbi:ABC transporter substrate-binding protein [Paracoccus sp. SM22M-07]|uniref:ABC transporter substrate-binding protein n=1 Tax=Paracoccus sp. SM22M-07 TaxID=1520813 RepID=UPI00091DE13C|nr:ABC transporter substrate-binding protein [Paracoccus sp. SM22M-07]OJH43098.1 ABC transporter substrate-binding protein [Paracoccus sp. SM22M-07]
MTHLKSALLATSILAGAAPMAHADDDVVRVGLVYTLSGPAAVLGEHSRDGFLLAMEKLDNKLGGKPVEIIVVDDEQKPDIAVSRARELVESKEVDFVVGPVFSNIVNAIVGPVTDGGAFLISTNAGTSNLAGAECNPDLFVTSYQNDQMHEVSGKYAQDQGFQNVFLLAPNYQAGKDALAGFKHSYTNGIAGEILVPLGQLDFSAELAQIAAIQPDAIYAFMPGGMGVNLVKQFNQAGMTGTPFLSAFTVDETTLPAQQDAALGLSGGSNWAPDMDTPESRDFVENFIAAYDRVPAVYAMQAYDAAMLIDSAVSAVEGNLSDRDALREALKAADFTSLRGDFAFGPNHYPIQDFYLTKVVKRDDGLYSTSIDQPIFEDYADNYAADCTM